MAFLQFYNFSRKKCTRNQPRKSLKYEKNKEMSKYVEICTFYV